MKIDHIILGCKDIQTSKKFYEEILDFIPVDEFIDTGTGNKGLILKSTNHIFKLKILLVSFANERLPSPQHIAFEITENDFKKIYAKANSIGLVIRSEPSLKSTELGVGKMKFENKMFKIFYLIDPSGINLEFMTSYDSLYP